MYQSERYFWIGLFSVVMMMLLANGMAIADDDDKDKHSLKAIQTIQNEILNLLEPKTIFVTSEQYDGNLGGLAGADAKCQSLAEGPDSIVPKGEEYVSLLSTPSEHASARITPSSGPYIRPDGVLVAANAAGLFQKGLDNKVLINPVNVNEKGIQTIEFGIAWTGSTGTGVVRSSGPYHCNSWTSNRSFPEEGGVGDYQSVGIFWIAVGQDYCDTERQLICVQR